MSFFLFCKYGVTVGRKIQLVLTRYSWCCTFCKKCVIFDVVNNIYLLFSHCSVYSVLTELILKL